MKEVNATENLDVEKNDSAEFQSIQPESGITTDEAKNYWDQTFDSSETSEDEIKNTLKAYIDDIRQKSDLSETIPEDPIKVEDLRKVSPEENAQLRDQFSDPGFKRELKHQWEEANGREWPKYSEDVYITNARGEQVLIRKAGSDYDAHHIQPLCLGGKNEASNLTPLRADVHFDHRGVHEFGSPFDQLNKMLGGTE
jgi:hypothetical protein